ncbi:Protein F17B5.6 [Aphelenchoides avenae]|nr:Protein F17B5.6 [Aphelenchus avenae]
MCIVQFKDLLPVYIPKNMSRGDDLYFASTYCDSLLLTSSASTFGWWMGYLMPEGRQVFYNWNVTSFGNHSKERYDYDYFPGEWTGLRLLPNRTVMEFSKWHYEVDSDFDNVPNNVIAT